MPSTLTMTNEEKALISVQPMTEAGNPAPVDGDAQFVVTSGTCTTERVDQLRAYVVSGSEAGDSLITITCDADLGSGTTPVTDVVTVHVTSATAESLYVTVGSPELKG